MKISTKSFYFGDEPCSKYIAYFDRDHFEVGFAPEAEFLTVLKKWCHENISSSHYSIDYVSSRKIMVFLNNDVDIILFKLRWS